MNWLPVSLVDAMAPTTGFAGTEAELLVLLRRFADVGCDEVQLIPTSADVSQVERVAALAAGCNPVSRVTTRSIHRGSGP